MEKQERGTRKIREGVVVSNKMNKTVTVRVERTFRHPQFEKVVTRAKKYYAHTEEGNISVGQRVRIEETRPISKLKHWRVLEVVS
jgi:small subunit ribosomal protein S17